MIDFLDNCRTFSAEAHAAIRTTIQVCCCLILGAQNSVSVNSQDVSRHKAQPPKLQQGYHATLPPQQSPYMNQPGIKFYVHLKSCKMFSISGENKVCRLGHCQPLQFNS